MPPYVFALRRASGVPPKIAFRGDPPEFDLRRHPYRLIEDDEVAEYLRKKEHAGTPCFRHLSPEDVDEALESASEAVDAIEAGEYDDVLDMLLVAERRAFDARITVINAIADRRRALKEQLRDEDDASRQTVAPADVAPHALG